ncbi:unnamed protein product [Brassica oleracea var. botrytis]
MGNCVAFQFSCDQTVNCIIRCLRGKGFIRNLEENLKDLQRERDDLKAIQQQVKNRVAREETQHRDKDLNLSSYGFHVSRASIQRSIMWLLLVPLSFKSLYSCCWKMLKNSNQRLILRRLLS